jgi:hypothetical protein
MRAISVLLIATAACGVTLEERPGSQTGAVLPDAGMDVAPAPRCSNGRALYLDFDGVALTRGTPSDATQNRASWMSAATGRAPRYKSAAADRDPQILAIVSGVRQALATFPIDVVTQRPATGPYVMVVFGGSANDIGSSYSGAVSALDCGDANKSDVAWISDAVSPLQLVVNYTIGAIGYGLGLTATTDPTGCMCGWDNNCSQNLSAPCRLSPTISRDPNSNRRCAGAATQDEVGAFATEFCR